MDLARGSLRAVTLRASWLEASPLIALVCVAVLASSPAAHADGYERLRQPAKPATAQQFYEKNRLTCRSFTDGCQTCANLTTNLTSRMVCSTSGIACLPRKWVCRERIAQ
jgi:hypothetical protein